jgi:hypothetical protein
MRAAEIFKLKRPCATCPFRTDVDGYLRRGRAIEIATSIANGAIFSCHKTVEYELDEEPITKESSFCAGALLVMENEGAPNQAVRMAERMGLYDAAAMDRSAPVVASFAAFVEHHSETIASLVDEMRADEEAAEDMTCCVVDAGCEAPAGYLVGGVVIPGDDGEVTECPVCGENVCDNCSNDAGVCRNCALEDDE